MIEIIVSILVIFALFGFIAPILNHDSDADKMRLLALKLILDYYANPSYGLDLALAQFYQIINSIYPEKSWCLKNKLSV